MMVCHWFVFSSVMPLILYSDCAKVILTFVGKKQLGGLIYPSTRCKNMIHDGRGFALGKPCFNWCVGVELLASRWKPFSANYHCSVYAFQKCIRKCSKVSMKQVTQVSAEAREGQAEMAYGRLTCTFNYYFRDFSKIIVYYSVRHKLYCVEYFSSSDVSVFIEGKTELRNCKQCWFPD